MQANNPDFQYRSATAGSTNYTFAPNITLPYWFRLVRQGSMFSAYASSDGASWSQVGSPATIPMATAVYVGLAVSAEASSGLTTATLDNVTLINQPDFLTTATPLSQAVTSGLSTTYAVNVAALGGFAEAVTLSATGLPAGAGATFSPPSVTGSGSSTMTVSTAPTTPSGSSTLTITGSGSTRSHTATVSLTVGPPDFTISASPVSQTARVGISTTYTVNLAALGAFAGSVNLAVTGLPAGATGSFSATPVVVPGSPTLTVNIGSNTPGRTYTLIIIGTSGSLSHSTSVVLTVPVPDFFVSTPYSWLKMAFSGTLSGAVNVTGVNGFNRTVDLSVTGLPAGASATFTPASFIGGGVSTLSISAGTAVSGSYPITITGTSIDPLNGSPVRSTTVALIVDATTGALPAPWTSQDLGNVGIPGG